MAGPRSELSRGGQARYRLQRHRRPPGPATAPRWLIISARFRAARPWFCSTTSPDPNEAGIFYVRHPDEAVGRITSLTIKQPPVVVGDGRSTLRALILADERARLVPHLYLDR